MSCTLSKTKFQELSFLLVVVTGVVAAEVDAEVKAFSGGEASVVLLLVLRLSNHLSWERP